MTTQNLMIQNESVFYSSLKEYNKEHESNPIVKVNGSALSSLLGMYEDVNELFEYFENEEIGQLLDMLNNDLFKGAEDEQVSLNALHAHNKFFTIKLLVVTLLKLKNKLILFDSQAKNLTRPHTF